MSSIPSFPCCDRTKATGSGNVIIPCRKDAEASGLFSINISVAFDPLSDIFPTGNVFIHADLSNSLRADFKSTDIQLINSYGLHTPTICIAGRCTCSDPRAKGLHYWLLVATIPNSVDSDIVSFLIKDNNNQRVAYGTGSLIGNIAVAPH